MDAYDQARERTGEASLAAHETYLDYYASPTTAHRNAWRKAEATLKRERAALERLPAPQDGRTQCITSKCPGHHGGGWLDLYCPACLDRLARAYGAEEMASRRVPGVPIGAKE